MWGMLWSRRLGMGKTEKGPANVSGHGNIDPSAGIVPAEGQAKVLSARPIRFNFVVLGKRSD